MSWVIKKVADATTYYTGMMPDQWTGRMDHAMRFDRCVDASLIASGMHLTGVSAVEYQCDCGRETYQILYAKTSDELVAEVRAYQRDGWVPLGGPYFANAHHRQAMVRENRDWLLPHHAPPVWP